MAPPFPMPSSAPFFFLPETVLTNCGAAHGRPTQKGGHDQRTRIHAGFEGNWLRQRFCAPRLGLWVGQCWPRLDYVTPLAFSVHPRPYSQDSCAVATQRDYLPHVRLPSTSALHTCFVRDAGAWHPSHTERRLPARNPPYLHTHKKCLYSQDIFRSAAGAGAV
jgi:hypothetical protein